MAIKYRVKNQSTGVTTDEPVTTITLDSVDVKKLILDG